MAHFITLTDKLAYVGRHPWHIRETGADGRSVFAGDEPVSGETLRQIALPWEPVKVPLYFAGSHAEEFTLLNRNRDLRSAEAFAIVRNDGGGLLTPGRAVSATYTPFANADLVRLGDLLVDSGEARWHTLLSMLGGRHVAGSLQAAGEITVRRGGAVIDTLAPMLMLFQAHDGTHSLEAMFTTIRPECANTVQAARSGAGKGRARIRHTASIANVEATAERIKEILGIARESFAEQADTLNALAAIDMRRRDFVEFVAQIVTGEDDVVAAARAISEAKGAAKTRLENRSVELLTCIEDGIAMANQPDTAYKAVQGVAEFIDHQRGRSATWKARNTSLGLDSALFGTGAEVKRRAVQLLLKRAA